MTQASDRKNQIILATIECISRYGYHNFSMQDLAQRADVSKGIIHYYFLNKEALMMAVLDHICRDIEGLLEGTESILNPIERLSHVIWMCADILRTKREYYRISMAFWTQIDQKKHVRSAISDHYASFRTAIAGIIELGIKKELFRKGNPEIYATMIIAMIDGIALQWLFDESLFDYDDLVKNCEMSIMGFLQKDSQRDSDKNSSANVETNNDKFIRCVDNDQTDQLKNHILN